MDKTLALVVTATVLLLTALTVIYMTQTSVEDFQDDKSDLGDTGCEFQRQQVENNEDVSPEDVSSNCRTEELEQEYQTEIFTDSTFQCIKGGC